MIQHADAPRLVSSVRNEVADELAQAQSHTLDADDRRELARQLIMTRLQRLSSQSVASGGSPMTTDEEQKVAKAVLDSLFGLGRIQVLIDDPAIENIDINGCDHVWVTYADGTKAKMEPIAESDAELIDILRSAAARFGLSERRFDTSQPELDLRLPEGSRLSALMSVVRRPVVSIRRHRYVDLTLGDLIQLGALGDDIAGFLTAVVRARKNLVVGGAMNSGKTTLVRALAAEIPPRERIITIEQAFELGLDTNAERHPDLVALEARPPNSEGEGEVSMARLVRRALRMNADRVIVGEVLGDEVLPMLNAMSQGRSGSMCTIHADSSVGIFRRLASYAIQAPERLPLESTYTLIAGAIHFAVFLDVSACPGGRHAERRPSGSHRHESIRQFEAIRRRRFVASIREVVGAEGLSIISNEVFRIGPDGQVIQTAPLQSQTLGDLIDCGFDPHTRRVEAIRW